MEGREGGGEFVLILRRGGSRDVFGWSEWEIGSRR